ncbi:protein SMG6 [Microdochium nivale]|nr:protein SMG6 [Microdochium nivale]
MSKTKGIDNSFTTFLRRAAKISCPLDDCGEHIDAVDNTIREHIKASHPDLLDKQDLAALVSEFRRPQSKKPGVSSSLQSGIPSLVPEIDKDESPSKGDASPLNPNKRIKSPNSPAQVRGRSSSPLRRSRGHHGLRADHDPDFKRSTTTGGSLWSPQRGAASSQRPAKPRVQEPASVPAVEESFKQPETRPISQDQLVAEVKGIYAGLVMVESKCIEVDNAQSSQNDTKLNNEQWQALIALHRTLLHEHHDFFLASQHPAASPALKRLATKYAMPARMWRHGIHSFLELLRHRLPASLEHMLTFIYLAYSMMALLYETVPAFEDTWIECLGDLSRYRMAIEDDDIRDREIWTSVSRHWYSKASDKAPSTGRLYHHLAILARPNVLQQLYYYSKSLCVPLPFISARESILTLFDPLLNRPSHAPKLASIEAEYVKCHGILFTLRSQGDFDASLNRFLESLDNHMSKIGRRWMESGYHTAVANSCAIMGHGKEDNILMKAFQEPNDSAGTPTQQGATTHTPDTNMQNALRLANGTASVVLGRLGDDSVFPFLHVSLVFLYHIAQFNVMSMVGQAFPWKLVCELLNSMLLSYRTLDRIRSTDFPVPAGRNTPRPLPEDFAMKGLLWTNRYFPNDFFVDDKIDDDEKYFEVASMTDERCERILWIASRLAENQQWLTVNQSFTTFGVLDNTMDRKEDTFEPSADLVMVDADKAA